MNPVTPVIKASHVRKSILELGPAQRQSMPRPANLPAVARAGNICRPNAGGILGIAALRPIERGTTHFGGSRERRASVANEQRRLAAKFALPQVAHPCAQPYLCRIMFARRIRA